ncbi:hypothetical protein [Brevifollis gellanilyticus]|uniref:Stress-response A/B barrel domain-containing protein n=1 Tax=Brevifollis gellanilyticus TaxID=748831 RepID=A0A512M2H7_9BACT|nr:hypothetical protein [Brevifollis gellanilyticus]GEP40942.1 hypothetical protein BGE01nite_02330 [Brevifollis gellanilyticus]
MSHHLVQILLPLFDNQHEPLPGELHEQVKAKLTHEFGGVTAYVQAPAEGRWKDAGDETRDEMVMYEAVVDELDPAWWAQYRIVLMSHFQQKDIMVRALPILRL